MNKTEKPRLAISFSGGRSSAVMLALCLRKYGETHDIVITFANTGCEHEDTLRFVNDVDKNIAGGKVVWIEAEIHGKGKGPTAKTVSYGTASRNAEPMESAIAKHGVFCSSNPQCTWRLKVEPMEDYIKNTIGWKKGTYDTAIGIRADEIDRVSKKYKENRTVYPLIDAGYTKQKVNEYLARYRWDLKLPSDAYGNCVWCWKKSDRKLFTIAKESPEVFETPARLEEVYGHVKADKFNRVFFRSKRSATEIVRQANTTPFTPYSDAELFDPQLDFGFDCSASCEAH